MLSKSGRERYGEKYLVVKIPKGIFLLGVRDTCNVSKCLYQEIKTSL